MYFYQTLSGGFVRQSDASIKASVGTDGTARAVTGAETDETYEFFATVKITSGKVAMIVNFTYDDSWNQRYLEMVLNPATNKVTLEAVQRDDQGVETNREVLATYDITITTGTEYKLRMKSAQIAPTVYAVYGYVDYFIVVSASDLAAMFQKGMRGFECYGTQGQYSTISEDQFAKDVTTAYATLPEIKERLSIEAEDLMAFDAELIKIRKSVQGYIDTQIKKSGGATPLTTVDDDIRAICADLCAGKFKKARSGQQENPLWTAGVEALREYIDSNYRGRFLQA